MAAATAGVDGEAEHCFDHPQGQRVHGPPATDYVAAGSRWAGRGRHMLLIITEYDRYH